MILISKGKNTGTGFENGTVAQIMKGLRNRFKPVQTVPSLFLMMAIGILVPSQAMRIWTLSSIHLKTLQMYRNASDAVTDMRARGFKGFELSGTDLLKKQRNKCANPGEFMVIESHRFCVPAGSGSADVVVHGIVMVASMTKGILISQCPTAWLQFAIAGQ